MDYGEYTFARDIPPNLQRDMLARRAPAAQLNVDATLMSRPSSAAATASRSSPAR